MPDLGDALVFSAKVYGTDPTLDPSAQLVNASAVALTITLPDGTTVPSVIVTNPPANVGVYTYKYPTTTQAGTHTGRWVFTMNDGSTTVFTQQFDVQQTTQLLLGLDEAKRQLRIPVADTTQDENLRDWLAALTRPVEHLVGACVKRTIVNELVECDGFVLRTRLTPVISVISLTPLNSYGRSWATSDLIVTDEGRVIPARAQYFYNGAYLMTYVVGRDTTPPHVRMAVRIILQHLWATQRGAAQSPYLGGDDTATLPGFGYAIPARALELLQTDDRGPAVG